MAPLRILHALQTLKSGGIATIVRNLVESLPLPEFDHAVVVEDHAGVAVGPRDVAVHAIPPCPWWQTPKRIRRLRRMVRDCRIDVVHGYDWPGVDALIAGALCPGVALVFSDHGRPSATPRRLTLRQRLALRWLGSRLSHAYAVAPDLAAELASCLGWLRTSVPVVINGVDTDRMRPARRRERGDTTTFLFGIAGQLRPVKRPDLMVDMVRQLATEHFQRPFHVTVAGDGPLLGQLRETVRTDRLEEWISLPGAIQDMPNWYRSLDALLVTSDYEGCSMVILEAMASGLPVIATDSGLTRELLDDGAAGIVVTPGDSAQVAAAAERLMTNETLAAQLGSAARERAITLYSMATRQPVDARVYREAVDSTRNRGRYKR